MVRLSDPTQYHFVKVGANDLDFEFRDLAFNLF